MKKVLTIISLALAAAGVLVPIAWDYLKARSRLDLRINTATPIVQREMLVDHLTAFYNGNQIRELSRFEFSLINSGNTAISGGDIVQQPTIEFPVGSSVLSADISGVDPVGLKATTAVNSNRFSIAVELLNPTDRVDVVALVTTDRKSSTIVSARIKGIKNLTIIDQRGVDRVPKRHRATWVIVLISTGIFFCVLMVIIMVPEARAFYAGRRRVRADPNLLANEDQQGRLSAFMRMHLKALAPKEIRHFQQKHDDKSYPRNELISDIIVKLNEVPAALSVGIVMSLIALAGIWYLVF